MATLDAIAFSAGRARIDFGHFRTNKVWARGAFVYLNSLSPGADMTLWESRRQSNHDPNTTIRFDDIEDDIELLQNLSRLGGIASMAATAWRLVVEYCDGFGNVTWLIIDPSDGSVDASGVQSSPGAFAHSQPQWTYFGASYDGSSQTTPLAGRMCLMFAVKGANPGIAGDEGFAAFAQDPLNVGDLWLQTYTGSNADYEAGTGNTMYWVDDSEVDRGPNGSALTLTSVSYGSGNGPTVTDRSGTIGTGDEPTITGVDFFDTVYEYQQRVKIYGSDFGSEVPLVFISEDQLAESGDSQVVAANSDTEITLKEIVFDEVAPGSTAWLNVVNQTVGDQFGLVGQYQIGVEADPGANTVARRLSGTSIPIEESVAISTIETAPYFHKRDAQGALTYSATGLPTGLSINSSTGVITGTPSAAGVYSVTVRATDPNGDYVETSFSWSISASQVTTKSPGTWGRRTRRVV